MPVCVEESCDAQTKSVYGKQKGRHVKMQILLFAVTILQVKAAKKTALLDLLDSYSFLKLKEVGEIILRCL